MLEHGGRLRAAIQRYGIAEDQWVDLSSGIAPWSFPIPEIATRAWARLPETDDGLESAACTYYGVGQLLPVPGSQAAIQLLPRLRRSGRVGVLSPCYAEHAEGWRRAGHRVREVGEEEIEFFLDQLDVLVVVNPNNPTGLSLSPQRLLDWHSRLAQRGGWLVVDEAFMDVTPQVSLAGQAHQVGLIVLRSFGKFFGLAGVRLGFVLAQGRMLELLAEQLGPWTVSGPTRALGRACLAQRTLQAQQSARCLAASERLQQLLAVEPWLAEGSCGLFQWRVHERPGELFEFMAQRGILLRLFVDTGSLRFGLPGEEAHWQRLQQALAAYAEAHP